VDCDHNCSLNKEDCDNGCSLKETVMRVVVLIKIHKYDIFMRIAIKHDILVRHVSTPRGG